MARQSDNKYRPTKRALDYPDSRLFTNGEGGNFILLPSGRAYFVAANGWRRLSEEDAAKLSAKVAA